MAPPSEEEVHSPRIRMLAMQGNSSQDSYAHNSSCQNYHFHAVAKPRLAIALKHVVRNISRICEGSVEVGSGHDGLLAARPQQRQQIVIADLGCSHGRNTLDYAEFVLSTLQQNLLCGDDDAIAIENQLRMDKEDDKKMQNRTGSERKDSKELQRFHNNDIEIQYFFSDLPSNDFNALFQSLQPYLYQGNGVHTGEDNRMLPKIFAAGVPGSFYGRLFPSASLHLVICSYSLHWLSQVPTSVFDRSSLAWNGGHTWINNASASVESAYAQQFKVDMKSFLTCRALELAHGGVMFLFISARPSKRNCLSTSNLDFIPLGATFELFDYAFKEMVDEGLLSIEEMEMFNMPGYAFDQHDFECVLLDIPELDVLHMETVENMALFQEQKDRMHAVQQWTQAISSAMRPLLEAHLGKFKANEVLKRIKIIASKLDCFDVPITNTLLIACLQRRL